jgi:hypothetical protein
MVSGRFMVSGAPLIPLAPGERIDELRERGTYAGHAFALGQLARIRASDYDVIRALGQTLGLGPERLPQYALHARPIDGAADSPRHGESQPWTLRLSIGLVITARERVQHQEAVALRASLAVDALELGAARQPAPLRAPPAARAPRH